MAQITLNEGLAWLKTLKKRHEELIALRNGNAHRGAAVLRRNGGQGTRQGASLRRQVTRQSRHTCGSRDPAARRGDEGDQSKTVGEGYDQDDAALGELM